MLYFTHSVAFSHTILGAFLTLSWVDVLVVGCFIRIIYIGRKNGITTEIFKLVGIICATFISVHYYIRLGDFIKEFLLIEDSIKYVAPFCLIVLVVSGLFSLIREGWIYILRIGVHPLIDQWGGLVFSVVRSYFICGLVFLALLIYGNGYCLQGAQQSLSKIIFQKTSIIIYDGIYTNFVSKYFPNELRNDEAFKAVSRINLKTDTVDP